MIRHNFGLRALPVALCLSACQPLPHPFETSHDLPENRLMALPDVVGIAIDPVNGVPARTSDTIRATLAKALQDVDVPASAAPAGEHAYHVGGKAAGLGVRGTTSRISLTWIVTNAAGEEIGRKIDTIVVDSASWQVGNPDVTGQMQIAAREIAEILHLPGAPPPPPPKSPPPPLRLVLEPVVGAPGDGDTSLPRALTFALRDTGVEVLDQPDRDVPRVAGTVTLSPLAGGQQNVRILWTVFAADNRQIGTVAQENAVPRGSLDGPWSDAAAAVAEAAADSVRGLVAQAMQQGHSTQ